MHWAPCLLIDAGLAQPAPAPRSGALMRAILLWLLGVPISVIILLKLFGVF